MKRHIIAASCVVLAATVLSSCQKEDKSVVDLANELTAELQQVTDPATANAHAARVKVLNQRLQNASVRVLALNDTALLRGAGADEAAPGSDYAKALSELAREVGRVRASYPAAADEEPDNAKLLIAIRTMFRESCRSTTGRMLSRTPLRTKPTQQRCRTSNLIPPRMFRQCRR